MIVFFDIHEIIDIHGKPPWDPGAVNQSTILRFLYKLLKISEKRPEL